MPTGILITGPTTYERTYVPLEDVLMGLSDEEAEYVMCLRPEQFWQWVARKEREV